MTGLGLDENENLKAVMLYVVCIRCPAGYPCTWVTQVRGKAVRLILYQLGGGQDRGIRARFTSVHHVHRPIRCAQRHMPATNFPLIIIQSNRIFDICVVGVPGKVTKKWLPARLPPWRLYIFSYNLNTICLSSTSPKCPFEWGVLVRNGLVYRSSCF